MELGSVTLKIKHAPKFQFQEFYYCGHALFAPGNHALFWRCHKKQSLVSLPLWFPVSLKKGTMNVLLGLSTDFHPTFHSVQGPVPSRNAVSVVGRFYSLLGCR